MTKEITTFEALQDHLSMISSEAPANVRQLIQGNIHILNAIQSPTLVDSTLSHLVNELQFSIDECFDNPQKVKQIRRIYISMIENLINFLDIKLRYSFEYDKNLSEKAFVQAGNMFMDNLRDCMLMAVNTFGMATKVAASSVDHVGRAFLIQETALETVDAIAYAAKGVSNTDSVSEASGQTSHSYQETAGSDGACNSMAEVGKAAIEKITEHEGEFSQEVATHMDGWIQSMTGVIIHNIFTPEKEEKRTELLSTFYGLITKGKRQNEQSAQFIETVSNTINKLKKYQDLIGKSIVISDMIERYVKELKKYAEKKAKKPFPEKLAGLGIKGFGGGMAAVGASVLMPEFVVPGLLLLGGSGIYDMFSKKQSEKGQMPEDVLKEYEELAQKFLPDMSRYESLS